MYVLTITDSIFDTHNLEETGTQKRASRVEYNTSKIQFGDEMMLAAKSLCLIIKTVEKLNSKSEL